MASERSVVAVGPPLAYRIDEVRLHLTRSPGAKTGATVRGVSIFGTGSALLERDGRQMPFSYPQNDLLALLNAFYRIHFFDLPTRYNVRHSVFLKDDGSIGTSALRMLDAETTIVCFAVSTYEKCVTYGNDGPRELEDIAKRVFAEADRLAK